MSNPRPVLSRWSALALIAFTAFTLNAQSQSKRSAGFVDDWSTHHVLFSEPGTLANAITTGRYGQWLRVLNQPRYAMQQQKRHQATPRSESADRPGGFGKISTGGARAKLLLDRDWSMSLAGSTATGAMASNAYPAKYSFATNSALTTASCTADYVAYTTGIAGSALQATIVGFKNLYATTCGATTPTIAFAYNTGGSSNLSPTLAWDGTQIAYIQTTSGVASLVLLKPSLTSGGTSGAPATDIGAAVAPSAYRTCSSPCFTTLQFSGSPNDTNSSPFYVYDGSDTLYVGDDSGRLHKFTGVFYGNPAEVTAGWPVTASAETAPTLTSPIYDSTSQLVFVGDATGYLHSVTTRAGAETVLTSNQMDCGTGGFVDPPLVDSTTEQVYAFIGYSCATPRTGYVNRFAAGASISGSYGTGLALTTSPSTSSTLYAGSFDNEYYTTSGVTGNLYVCAFGSLLRIPITHTTTFGTLATYNAPVSTTTTCSPITEFLGSKANTALSANLGSGKGNTKVKLASGTGTANGDYIQIDSEIMQVTRGGGTTSLTATRAQLGTSRTTHTEGAAVQDISGDWIYMSVASRGNSKGCTGACLYNYNVLNSGTTGTATTGQTATGGTSGIIIDNLVTSTGASQIYYTTQGNATCTGNGTTGTGTHGCAIQASQSLP